MWMYTSSHNWFLAHGSCTTYCNLCNVLSFHILNSFKQILLTNCDSLVLSDISFTASSLWYLDSQFLTAVAYLCLSTQTWSSWLFHSWPWNMLGTDDEKDQLFIFSRKSEMWPYCLQNAKIKWFASVFWVWEICYFLLPFPLVWVATQKGRIGI